MKIYKTQCGWVKVEGQKNLGLTSKTQTPRKEMHYLVMAQEQGTVDKYDYMNMNDRCAVCWWPSEKRGRHMELHHIVGGPGRKDVIENWICLCSRCHHAVHNKLPEYGELPKGSILTAKADVDVLDVDKLASLTGRKALSYEPCEIPQKFLEDRGQQGGVAWP